MGWRRRFRNALRTLSWWGFLGIRAVFFLLGPRLARRLARALARAAGLLLPWERRQATRHLVRAFPNRSPSHIRRIRGRMWAHFGESAIEMLFPEQVLTRPNGIVIEGLEVLEAARAAGRGVIVVTGHLGNWELMAAAVARQGLPCTVIARRIFDPRFDGWMRRWRERHGIETLVRDAPDATKRMLRAFRDNRLVGILIDQDTDVASVWVPFFGHPAKTPDAPARLARRGIPIVVGGVRRTGAFRHVVRFEPFAPRPDIEATMARLNAALEVRIRDAPEQWVWIHRRWRTPPPVAGSGGAAGRD